MSYPNRSQIATFTLEPPEATSQLAPQQCIFSQTTALSCAVNTGETTKLPPAFPV